MSIILYLLAIAYYLCITDYLEVLNDILSFPASVNLYVFHGGTTFGFYNGANMDIGVPGSYHPDTSSYGIISFIFSL